LKQFAPKQLAPKQKEERTMWTKPAYIDLRIGFEVTMYFANR
jgi:pyrroloquinoline quinone biosynthesis protein A